MVRNSLDPSASPLDHYGCELRRYREADGLTLKELGARASYTGSLIGQVETAKKVPTRQFSKRMDDALKTDGALQRLVGLVLRSQLPAWFAEAALREAKAAEIYVFQAQLVHGLLQTEEYARAVLGAVSQDGVEGKVAARLDRQRVLAKDDPPVLWVVLGEAVLYQEIGGRAVMRRQLAHLLDFGGNPWVNVQVLPFVAGAHAGLQGSFTLYRFESDPALVSFEGYGMQHVTPNPAEVRDLGLRYAHLQAAALSLQDSAELIQRVMEERYGDHTRAPRSPVA
ncbi:helix-turn-helix domain-containing protein [Streptomyces sp. NPDC017056]|uniref:helix-turn-helix domain-containing protein n=1 Tax=Streptomyces sp. NPDC017056 TaxID=3364973 RepID=UPI00378CDBF5